MKFYYLAFLLLLFGACSKHPTEVFPLPDDVCTLHLDSVDSGVILNATGIVASSDYLVVSNLSRDTIFDVFDRNSLRHLYSGLIYGQGPDDMLPFRWIRHYKGNEFYAVGLGAPILTEIALDNRMNVKRRKKIEWEKDICQNIYPLSDDKVLIQPGKKCGEWSLHDISTGKIVDMPEFPFIGRNDSDDMIEMFKKRAVNVAVKSDGKRIAFFYAMLPFVRFYDSEGMILHEWSVGQEITDAADNLVEKKRYFTSCVSSEELIFVKYDGLDTTGDCTCLQVWDWDGFLLGSFRIDSRVNLFTVSPDSNKLYAVKGDNDFIFWCDLQPVIDEVVNRRKRASEK